ncbi:hypothetical protein CDFC105_73083 [Clostridioides difficile]|nr:hypothetical protein CDFC105_60665 [Clostridioides difficile]CZS09305.1 hypothetical protein CDFC105_73083 [Clostridioides difficile]
MNSKRYSKEYLLELAEEFEKADEQEFSRYVGFMEGIIFESKKSNKAKLSKSNSKEGVAI